MSRDFRKLLKCGGGLLLPTKPLIKSLASLAYKNLRAHFSVNANNISFLNKRYLFRLKLLTKRTCFRETPVRLVGLSTALANAGDVGEWLGIKDVS